MCSKWSLFIVRKCGIPTITRLLNSHHTNYRMVYFILHLIMFKKWMILGREQSFSTFSWLHNKIMVHIDMKTDLGCSGIDPHA